jgi:hypothetical protein
LDDDEIEALAEEATTRGKYLDEYVSELIAIWLRPTLYIDFCLSTFIHCSHMIATWQGRIPRACHSMVWADT